MLRWPVLLVVGVLAVALVGLAGWKVGSYLRPHAYHGMVLQSPQTAPNFTLTDQHGQPVSLKDFRGKIVMLFFGYTTCPDVCPVTLSVVNKARESLGADAKDVQVVMVSVDPQRDTPEVMGEYVARYDPSFIGLTGAPDKIAEQTYVQGLSTNKNNYDFATLQDNFDTMYAADLQKPEGADFWKWIETAKFNI